MIWAPSALSLMTSIRAVAAEPAHDQASKPSIILCMTHDQGWGDVSDNGLKQIQTPRLSVMLTNGEVQVKEVTVETRGVTWAVAARKPDGVR